MHPCIVGGVSALAARVPTHQHQNRMHIHIYVAVYMKNEYARMRAH